MSVFFPGKNRSVDLQHGFPHAEEVKLLVEHLKRYLFGVPVFTTQMLLNQNNPRALFKPGYSRQICERRAFNISRQRKTYGGGGSLQPLAFVWVLSHGE